MKEVFAVHEMSALQDRSLGELAGRILGEWEHILDSSSLVFPEWLEGSQPLLYVSL